jgi:hypothetical protein
MFSGKELLTSQRIVPSECHNYHIISIWPIATPLSNQSREQNVTPYGSTVDLGEW